MFLRVTTAALLALCITSSTGCIGTRWLALSGDSALDY